MVLARMEMAHAALIIVPAKKALLCAILWHAISHLDCITTPGTAGDLAAVTSCADVLTILCSAEDIRSPNKVLTTCKASHLDECDAFDDSLRPFVHEWVCRD